MPWKNGPLEKESSEKWSPGKKVLGKMVAGILVPGEMIPGKMVPEKIVGCASSGVVCVGRILGCDQSMKTQNLTTNLPWLFNVLQFAACM